MNKQSGEERLTKACGKQAIQVFIREGMLAANSSAAAVESARNEIVNGFGKVANMTGALISATVAQQLVVPPKKGLFGGIKAISGKLLTYRKED